MSIKGNNEQTIAIDSAPRLPDADAIRKQVERIASDPLFNTSKRFTTLLRFIVDRTVEGQHDSLKERIIGIEIFGRSPDYDTSNDATVRVAVTELRKRLHSYYNHPGHKHEIRIDLPPRSYVAEINEPEPSEPEKKPHRRITSKRRIWSIAIAVLLLMLAGGAVLRQFATASAIDRFWSPIEESSGTVVIALGALPITVPVSSSSAHSPQSTNQVPANSLYGFAEQQPSFPLNDVASANSLASFLGLRGKAVVTRTAEVIATTDLRGGPIVLIGGFRNDWAMRLGVNLRYQLKNVPPPGPHINWVEDAANPSDRSWQTDLNAPLDNYQVAMDYAIVSRVLDLGTGQWWIGIAGMTGLATQAAEQALVNPQMMETLGKSLPKGWQHKNLQIVFEVKVIRGSTGATRPVALYSW